ncbi:MAG: hypothetical protein IT423_06030, partial [Pirellulaceae bacterium]|nr:hypothetical protein [Pirellulaceae bacterium]
VLWVAVIAIFTGLRMVIEFFSIAHAPIPKNAAIKPQLQAALSVLAIATFLLAIFGAGCFSPAGLWRNALKFKVSRLWILFIMPWCLATVAGSLLLVSLDKSELATSPVGQMVASSTESPQNAAASPALTTAASQAVSSKTSTVTSPVTSLGQPWPKFYWNLAQAALVLGVLHLLLGLVAFRAPIRAGFAGLIAGAILGPLLLLFAKFLMESTTGTVVAAVATVGVPVSLFSYVLANFAMIGFCSTKIEELDREWWSSINSRLLMIGTGWAILMAISIYGPWLLALIWLHSNSWWGYLTSAAGLAWLGTLAAGLQAAQSSDTESKQRGGLKEAFAQVAPVLFITSLLLASAFILNWIVYDIYAWMTKSETSRFFQQLPKLLTNLESEKCPIPNCDLAILPVWAALLIATGVLGIFSHVLGLFIGVNTFSLQNLYANRLVRCYLGASRSNGERSPEPVVNMDIRDDESLSGLFPGPQSRKQGVVPDDSAKSKRQVKSGAAQPDLTAEKWGPIHIINGALNQKASTVHASERENMAAGQRVEERRAENLQFLERQAESFVFTPVYCGSESTGYCSTDEFAKNIKVGTAMAVSGAAVSPNMGYHSSPAITALLTVFNIRLGAWFGNPGKPETRNNDNPAASAGLLLSELTGMTDSNKSHVYISDGGHFENMGVYELIRRRCRFIVAIDAGADPKFHENVGRVVRQVRIDFGIWIDVDTTAITPNQDGRCAAHVVVGRIHYGDIHKPSPADNQAGKPGEKLPHQHLDDPRYSSEHNQGIIVWIKNSLTGDEPGDLVNHAAMNPKFPYDSTVDQFFNETQFESYRALGIHSVFKSIIVPSTDSEPNMLAVGTQKIVELDKQAENIAKNVAREKIFESIYNYWLTRPALDVERYVEENNRYASIHSALRQDPKLQRLARELYGTADEKQQALVDWQQPNFDTIAERLIANEMFTLLENVFLKLDLERQSRHPLHAGWMEVFRHWTQTPSLRTYWNGAPQGPHRANGLLHEFSPAFQRFIANISSLV